MTTWVCDQVGKITEGEFRTCSHCGAGQIVKAGSSSACYYCGIRISNPNSRTAYLTEPKNAKTPLPESAWATALKLAAGLAVLFVIVVSILTLGHGQTVPSAIEITALVMGGIVVALSIIGTIGFLFAEDSNQSRPGLILRAAMCAAAILLVWMIAAFTFSGDLSGIYAFSVNGVHRGTGYLSNTTLKFLGLAGILLWTCMFGVLGWDAISQLLNLRRKHAPPK